MGGKKASPTPTWASPSMEPKRKFKYILSLGTGDNAIPTWVVKSASRPGFTVTTPAEHAFMGHTFKFPGRVKWEPMDIVLMDPIDPEVASKVLGIIENAGYVLPSKWGPGEEWKKTLSKKKFSENNLGAISISTLDSEGQKVEEWQLFNVQITKVNYGELDYNSEELLTVTLGIVFDYAKHTVHNEG